MICIRQNKLQTPRRGVCTKWKAVCLMFPCFLVSLFLCFSASFAQENYPVIEKIENIIFGKSFPNLKISNRIGAIEKNVFGKTYPNDSLDIRTKRLKTNVLGISDNLQTAEINSEKFQDILYEFINEEISFKGLLPLVKDETALSVAFEQAKEILAKGYVSYKNLKNQYQDERYTLSGGTGAIIEVIKGFENDSNKKQIKLTELLAKQLVQAIEANPDDAQILYSPYINHFGLGFALSKDKKKF